jgi:hypothetical protein
MSGHVPHLIRQGPVLALTALTCLIALASTTAALAQAPDPAPLWKAYPLNPPKSTGTNRVPRPHSAPRQVDETRRSGASADRDAAPLAVAIAFYGVLAGLCALGVGTARAHVLRRRARPITCEIRWSPDEQGNTFRATAHLDGEEEWVVAQSGRFERRSPEPPEYDGASHAAYDQLLSTLYADGWLPYERGREWWAMRLRRTPGSGTPTPTRDG